MGFLFLFLRNLMEDKNAIFLAYILTIIYGIYKNFHLIENFDSLSKIEKPITEHRLVKTMNNMIDKEITEEEDIKLKHLHKMVTNNIKKNNSKKVKKVNNEIKTNNIPEIDSIISEELI